MEVAPKSGFRFATMAPFSFSLLPPLSLDDWRRQMPPNWLCFPCSSFFYFIPWDCATLIQIGSVGLVLAIICSFVSLCVRVHQGGSILNCHLKVHGIWAKGFSVWQSIGFLIPRDSLQESQGLIYDAASTHSLHHRLSLFVISNFFFFYFFFSLNKSCLELQIAFC